MKQIRILLLITGMLIALTACVGETEDAAVPTEVPTQECPMETLTIYSIHPETLMLVPVSVKKEKEKLSAKDIVSLVIDNLGEYNIIKPALKRKGKKLYISFSSRGEPVQNCNKKVEKRILECFANSLLDNIESCNDIIFQVEGKAYKSHNFKFKKDEVYSSR